MKQKRQSTAFTLTLLCAFFSLLLAACGSGVHSLKLRSKNGSQQAIPVATATSDTDTETGKSQSNKHMTFVGQIPDMHAWIALASDGKNVIVFTTDGLSDHTATFAQWFKGTVTHNTAQTMPTEGTVTHHTALTTPTAGSQTPTDSQNQTPTAGSQSQLTANFNQNAVTGTVTLGDEKAYPFTAHAITNPNSLGGLYRSEQTVNNVKYLAGWIIPSNVTSPSTSETPNPSATPSATNTSVPSMPETATPSLTPGTAETATPSLTPGTAETATPSPIPSVTKTVTPSGAIAAHDVNTSGAAAIINEQNGQLLQAPMPTAEDLASKQVTVPDLDTFNLNSCNDGEC